ncbi:unnamed protein product [Rhizophagus irregularis]|nr:unnamed protein product [Rhizophagus irregularis]
MEIGDLENSGLEETNVMNEAGGIFLQLSNKIDSAESKNKDASRGLIYSYFDFGEAVFKRCKLVKPSYGKDGSQALVKKRG